MSAFEESTPCKRASYIAFIHGALSRPSGDARRDGEDLAQQCLRHLNQLNDPDHFPPRLFVLLLSPAYVKQQAIALLGGIRKTFPDSDNISFIGCSVGGVIFDGEVHPEGALLICLASRLLTVQVEKGMNAREDTTGAVSDMLNRLLSGGTNNLADLNPFGNRWLLTFLPGYQNRAASDTYYAPDMHAAIIERTMGRFPVVGGVSSVGEGAANDSFQFAGWEVFTNTIVSALIESGAPTATSVAHGFRDEENTLQVKELSKNGREILSLMNDDESPAAVLERIGTPVLFGQMSADNRLVPVVPTPNPSGSGSVLLHRAVRPRDTFHILKPHRDEMFRATSDAISHALHRSQIENETPIGALLIFCMGLYRNQHHFGVDTSHVIKAIPALIAQAPCVGGLFDGEIGLDYSGKSIFTNWSVSSIVFADAIRQRALMLQGFEAQIRHASTLLNSTTLEHLVSHCLQLIFDTGYPGAMLSLLFHDSNGSAIIAVDAIGPKFSRIIDDTRRPLEGTDLLAMVAKDKTPLFIPNLSKHPDADRQAVAKSGLISQYVIPLKQKDGEVFAVLQVDLGDVSFRECPTDEAKPRLRVKEEQVLNALGAEIADALSGFIGQEEMRIARELDKALITCLACSTEADALGSYITTAVRALGASRGHVRMINKAGTELDLVAGTGSYYSAAQTHRLAISWMDDSPTATAYRLTEAIVYNDTRNRPRRYTAQMQFRDAPAFLAEIEADCASAGVPIKGEDGKSIGAFNINAARPWFFNQSKYKSLHDLGARFSLLIQHLRTKDSEQASRKKLEFRNTVGLDIAGVAAFANPHQALNEAISRLGRATQATVAALYLLDHETNTLVLRGHYNWAAPEWITAARYTIGEGWTGRAYQSQKPIYIADLGKYRKTTKMRADGKYVKEMFGGPLDDSFTVETIALPLRTKQRDLGVAVLYRRISRDAQSAATVFATLDEPDLIYAMENMATMVNALIESELAHWRQKEIARRESVLRALTDATDERFGLFLREILISYKALQVHLYLPSRSDCPGGIGWVAGGQRIGNSTTVLQGPNGRTDELVIEAQKNTHVLVETHELTAEERRDPRKAATEGLVKRACIPLHIPGDEWRGVLDLRWGVYRQTASSSLVHHLSEFLETLGRQVAGALRRRQLGIENQNSIRAVQAMGAMVVQSNHRTLNLLQEITNFPHRLLRESDDRKRHELLKELQALIGEGCKEIKRPLQLIEQIRPEKRIVMPLVSLLKEAIHEVTGDRISESEMIHFEYYPYLHLTVRVAPAIVRAAFVNIIHNAVKYCRLKQGAVLTVSMQFKLGTGFVQIVFADTGPGMDARRLEASLEGFVTTSKGLGVGVLLARVLVACSDGDFKIKSEKGNGTTVTITLPTI